MHTSEELRRALNAGAKMIGVNNRNLQTFQVSLETSERLIAEAPRDRIMISESGLKNAKSLRHLQTLGFRGFLIGEALMRATDPEKAPCAIYQLRLKDQPSLQHCACSHRPVAPVQAEIRSIGAQRSWLHADRSNGIQIKICGVTNVRRCAKRASNSAHK